MRATENLYTVPGSKFLEYARGTHHFVRSLQKITVFDEKLIFWLKTHAKKTKKKWVWKKCADAHFFQTPIGNFSETNAPPTNAFQIPQKMKNQKILILFRTGNPDVFFRTRNPYFFVRTGFFLEPEISRLAASSKKNFPVIDFQLIWEKIHKILAIFQKIENGTICFDPLPLPLLST